MSLKIKELPPPANQGFGNQCLSVLFNPLSAMKQGCRLFLFAVLLLLFGAVSCTHSFEDEDIMEAISDIRQLSHNYPDSAFLLLDALWEENRERLTDCDKINLYFTQGVMLTNSLKFRDAIDSFAKALQIAEQTDDVRRQVHTILGIADIKLVLGDTQEAFDHFHQAQLLLSSQTDMKIEVSVLYAGLLDAFAQIGQVDLAIDYAQRALDILRQEGRQDIEPLILDRLAYISLTFGNYLQAEENMREVIAILYALDRNRPIDFSFAYGSLSAALAQQDRLEEATAYAQKADEMANRIGLPAFAMQGVYNRKGEIYFREGAYENSLAMHRKALKLRAIGDVISLQAASKNAIGTAYSQLGNHDRALYYVNQALQIAQATQVRHLLIDVYNNLAAIYASQRDLDGFRSAIAVRDSLQASFRSEQHSRTIQDLRTRNEIAQREQRIAQQAEDLQRKGQITVLWIVIASLIFVLLVLRILYERRKMQNIKRIVQQYETISKLKQETQTSATYFGSAQQPLNDSKKDLIISEISEKLIPEIERLFNEEKIYKRQGLTMDNVAKMLNTNQRYLSKVINECYQTTFPEFVKTFRIDEAIEMLKEMHKGGKLANYTLEAIAEEVGFTGRDTFRIAFKEITGVTPTEYLQALKSS